MGDYVLSNAADADLAEIYVYSHRSFGEAQADA
jgi:toxin ParE1/3/4